MRHGITNLAIEGDYNAGLAYVPQARVLLQKVRNQMKLAGRDVMRGKVRLAEDAYAYVVVAGKTSSVRIVTGKAVQPEEQMVRVDWAVPDFLSGASIGGNWTNSLHYHGPPDVFWPTQECGRVYFLNARNATEPQDSRRLKVQTLPDIAPLGNNGTGFTQVQSLRPTLYTGLMRQVVQLLLGFGRPNQTSVYSDHQWRYLSPEQARKLLSDKRLAAGAKAYEKQVADKGRQIAYDYRFARTHGILTGGDGRLWLVEISRARGVLAMLLPMYPKTRTTAFADKVRKLNDSMAQTVLETLGGFPTGETYPPGPAGDAWKRAGAIQQWLNPEAMAPFYAYSAYFNTCGWAFSPSGTQAHNTGHKVGSDGIIEGCHYAVTMQVGTVVPEVRTAAAVEGVKRLFDPWAKIYPQQWNAAMSKLTRLSADDWATLISQMSTDVGAAFAWLDAKIMTPWAAGSATLSLVSKGKLFSKAKLKNQPQIKFPDEARQKILSFNFNPTPLEGSYGVVDFNTTMYVFYQGEELHLIKLYSNSATGPSSSNSDFEGCMSAGSWTAEQKGSTSLPTMFYTTTFDDRREIAASRTLTSLDGTEVGWVYLLTDWPYAPNWCTVWRKLRFSQHSSIEIWVNPAIASAILIPFGDRSAYYYALYDGYQSYTKIEQWSYADFLDPNMADGNRKALGYGDALPECGGTGRRVYRTYRQNVDCPDVADQGEWLSKCDGLDWIVNSTSPGGDLPPPSTINETSMVTLTVQLVYDGPKSPVEVVREKYYDEAILQGLTPGKAWFQPSPDDIGNEQYIYAACNTLGKGDLVEYQDNPNGNAVFAGGPYHGAMDTKVVTFVGVYE